MKPVALAIVMLALGCKWNFERMLVQHRVNPNGDDPLRLRLLAEAETSKAVAHETPTDPPEVVTGCSGNSYTARIPIVISDAERQSGQQRFAELCAACHGLSGTGETHVAEVMEDKKPKSFVVPPVRDYTPGRVFRTISLGYNRMPSYRNELGIRERWAVVAHVQALQRRGGGDAGPATHEPATPGPQCGEEAP